MEAFSLRSKLHYRLIIVLGAAAVATSLISGCGNVGNRTNSPTGGGLQGNTQVVLLVSSTANDRWSYYTLNVSRVSLANAAGNQVTLFSSPDYFLEFFHFNAASEPLISATIPQDVYTSASITYSNPTIACMNVSPLDGFEANYYTELGGPNSVTINFPSPITISGTAEALSLDLQISESTNLSGCINPSPGTVLPPYSLTPTFTVSPAPVSPQPTNDSDGKESGIAGRVVSLDEAAGAFDLQTATGSVISRGTGPPLTFSTGAGTIFQGISGLSELLVGMFVDMDAAIQADGSLLATRIAVQDTTATNMYIGPLVTVSVPGGNVLAFGLQLQGDNLSTDPGAENYYSFDANTAFKISGQFSDLSNLPFTAAFDASTMVAGQNVAIASGAIPGTAPLIARATTITLMPQTLNGTITALSTSGAYQVYTVGLASYDPIPTLTGVGGQSTSLTNPSRVQVYVNSSTQMLNSSPLSLGNIARFRGLLFNDSGTLRMVCLKVSDGVAE